MKFVLCPEEVTKIQYLLVRECSDDNDTKINKINDTNDTVFIFSFQVEKKTIQKQLFLYYEFRESIC